MPNHQNLSVNLLAVLWMNLCTSFLYLINSISPEFKPIELTKYFKVTITKWLDSTIKDYQKWAENSLTISQVLIIAFYSSSF